MKMNDWQKINSTKLDSSDVTPQNFLFYYRTLEWPQRWIVFDRSGHFRGHVEEEPKHLRLASGQMYNPVTKIWSVLDDATGRIIDGLESKTEYEFIPKLPN